jgi:hypothetical protein
MFVHRIWQTTGNDGLPHRRPIDNRPQASAQCHLLCAQSEWPGGRLTISLDKSKEIVYVLMGEHTQSAGFVWLVWQGGSA